MSCSDMWVLTKKSIQFAKRMAVFPFFPCLGIILFPVCGGMEN